MSRVLINCIIGHINPKRNRRIKHPSGVFSHSKVPSTDSDCNSASSQNIRFRVVPDHSTPCEYRSEGKLTNKGLALPIPTATSK